MRCKSIVATMILVGMSSTHLIGQAQPITIRAALAFDGTERIVSNATIVVRDGKIVRMTGDDSSPATYDLRSLTVLPGLVDTHVHLTAHFGRDGRATNEGETAQQAILYEAENAYMTLMAGFTTVQSVGSGSTFDVDVRSAIARGIMPGPHLLTSVRPINARTGAPDEIRAFVRQLKIDGADVIKLFAEIGGQTMTDMQIQAACGEATRVGLRSWVHAHSAAAMRAASLAGCTAVAHGSQATEDVLKLMAERGVYFEPNIGLVSQNYLENKARLMGTADFAGRLWDEQRFVLLEQEIRMKLDMFRRSLKVNQLKLIMGSDAVAGAHGRNAEEIIYRVRSAGQSASDALAGATSLNAQAIGMADRIGSIAPGMEADLIATDGNPFSDITALRRVVFVMKSGKVYKNIAPTPR